MENEKTAMVSGHICLDIIPKIDPMITKPLNEILLPGTLTTVTDIDFVIGGAVYNVGETLHRLGIKTKLFALIGDDDFGGMIEAKLNNSEAECILKRDKGIMTSFSIVLSAGGSDRSFLHAPGANNEFSQNSIDFEAVKNVDLFHFGYPPVMRNMFINDGKELVELFKKIKKSSVTISLDMAMPDPLSESGQIDWEKLLENVLPYVDIYAPSIEETLYMIDRPKYDKYKKIAKGGDMTEAIEVDIFEDVADRLHELGAKMVLLKCGGKGAYISTRTIDKSFGKACPKDAHNWSNQKIHEKCFKVKNVLSTTGAGDTTIAGFLASLLKENSIQEAMRNATAVGALCVQSNDAINAIKPLEEIEILFKEWDKWE